METISTEQLRYLEACVLVADRVEYGLPTESAMLEVKAREQEWVAA